ncbi:hypothetical protein GIB67_023710 [Kingdonia uniflora]|uniref:RING-type domain-containing protein n=1 Tax=Kingdonia uniflora TaxID=39325 RepID=A0A7J7MG88_9MAGN|nr:hypothetical protein GIB67_023710 [Kingdonia uniflora]
MPQRHSKNNNDLAYFTYDEKKKLGYGTQKERLGKDSIKPFDSCFLCLKPFIDPLCCQKGHVFCKECILECLLSQKKDIQSLFNLSNVISLNGCLFEEESLVAHDVHQKQENEEEEEKLVLQKAIELEAFDQQNHGAVPQYSDRSRTRDKNGFHGVNSVRVTSYEEEALRTMKAFWLPSATPEAPVKVDSPSTCTVCPEGREKLKLKTLFPIYFTEDSNEKKASKSSLNNTFICHSCKVTLTNTLTLTLVALSTCGHVFCKKCADRFMAVDKVCLICNQGCKDRNLVSLSKGGTRFAGHDENLEAREFKHLSSGSGLGLVRPTMKT